MIVIDADNFGKKGIYQWQGLIKKLMGSTGKIDQHDSPRKNNLLLMMRNDQNQSCEIHGESPQGNINFFTTV